MSSTSIDGLLKLLREMPTSGPGASTASLEVAAPKAMGDAILGAIYKKMDRPVTRATMRPSAVSKPSAAPKAMGDAILGAIYKKMDRPVTRATMRPSAVSKPSAGSKRVIKLKTACIINKYGLGSFIFYIDRDGNFGESSILTEEPYYRTRTNGAKQIVCETKNTNYLIPEETFVKGNAMINQYLEGRFTYLK